MSERSVQTGAGTADAGDFLGRMVTVHVDRSMGSMHPEHGWRYPVNYGFIPGTLSGDGEELDAYVLGVVRPLKTFRGRCIAVIRRLHERDDKLVVVPEGTALGIEEIARATHFQEQFFETQILPRES